jgi:hypothetical protein
MLVVKTVRVPVHCGITTRKLSILDSLTARTTYGVWLWSKLFKEHKLKGTVLHAGEEGREACLAHSMLLRYGLVDVAELS